MPQSRPRLTLGSPAFQRPAQARVFPLFRSRVQDRILPAYQRLRTRGFLKSHPVQSSRVPKPLPSPKVRPACWSQVPPAEERLSFAWTLPSPLAPPFPVWPPIRTRCCARRSPSEGPARRPIGGASAGGRGCGGRAAGAGKQLAVGIGRRGHRTWRRPGWRRRRPVWHGEDAAAVGGGGGRAAQGRWGELGLSSSAEPQRNLSRTRPEAGRPPEKVHARH